MALLTVQVQMVCSSILRYKLWPKCNYVTVESGRHEITYKERNVCQGKDDHKNKKYWRMNSENKTRAHIDCWFNLSLEYYLELAEKIKLFIPEVNQNSVSLSTSVLLSRSLCCPRLCWPQQLPHKNLWQPQSFVHHQSKVLFLLSSKHH